MAKLVKMYYYTKNGEQKLNSYYVLLSKNIVEKTNIKDNVKISVKDNKIILERE